jgi:hypothetical protein
VAQAPFAGEIEVVRGSLAGDRADAVTCFIAEHAGVEEGDARQDLGRVICLALTPDGSLAGVSSVVSAKVPLVAGVRLWLHGGVTAPGAAEATASAGAAATTSSSAATARTSCSVRRETTS